MICADSIFRSLFFSSWEQIYGVRFHLFNAGWSGSGQYKFWAFTDTNFFNNKNMGEKMFLSLSSCYFFQFIHSYLRKDARYLKPKFFRSSVAYSRSTCWIMCQTAIKKFQRLIISVCVFDPKGWVDVKRNILVTESHILRHLKWKGTGGGSLGEQGPGRAGSGSRNYKDTRLLFIKAKHPVKTQ